MRNRMELKPTERVRGRRAVEERLRFLRQYPLCKHCQDKDRVTAAQEVDHIIPLHKGGPDVDSNKQSMCAECHKVKTAIDMGNRPRVTIGLDGYPV